MEIALLFGSFIVLMMLSVPIGYAIGISTLLTLVGTGASIPLILIPQNAITGVDSFPLMAIPFFILAGNLMSSGGVAKRLVDFFDILIGWITGGLGIVTTLACMFFAAISGSAMATTSAIGGFMVPEMEERGYDRAFSSALAGAAGTIGVIIPPSIPFVIYAVVAGESISNLFIAGLLPGIAMGVALIITCVIVSHKKGYGKTDGQNVARPTFGAVWKSFCSAFWALLTPVIILGGIYAGIFTPTEAAVVAVVYCTFVSVVIYKELSLAGIYKALYASVNVNGMTTYMVGFSMAFAAYLTMQRIPGKIANAMLSLTDNGIILLILINLFLLVVGCLIDNIPATIILTPILLPVVTNLGMSPITFGVMLTMNLAIGFVTPPYGINLFVASAISNVPIGELVKPMLRFILALLIVLLLTTYFEPMTMGLVRLLQK